MIDVSGVNRPGGLASATHLVTDGLGLIYQAYQYALDASQDPWAFAVEISELRSLGMTNADFRWLICKGYLEHAREVQSPDGERRQFVFGDSLSFCERSCFQLTKAGLELARSLFDDTLPQSLLLLNGRATESVIACEIKPKWDGERHQFFVQDHLVKEFKVPSPNQETILTAFQEEDWPVRIDDPLAPSLHADCKRRLHDTIKGLNRNQKRNLIRFLGDGTGEGILWELIQPMEPGRINSR